MDVKEGDGGKSEVCGEYVGWQSREDGQCDEPTREDGETEVDEGVAEMSGALMGDESEAEGWDLDWMWVGGNDVRSFDRRVFCLVRVWFKESIAAASC